MQSSFISENLLFYLIELRSRALKLVFIYTLFFLLGYYFANEAMHYLLLPLIHSFLTKNALIVTNVASPVFLPMTIAANLALLFTTPFFFYQSFCFLAPALYQQERRYLTIAMVISSLLFLSGVGFCYYFVLPPLFHLFNQMLPGSIHYMPDLASALNFTQRLLLTFGICFQVPLICFLLVKSGWLSLATLITYRSYIIVLAFIIGMLLTPPDVLSQVLLAIPLCLLYELGIILIRVSEPTAKKTTTR